MQERECASHALERVRSVDGQSAEFKKCYRSYVERIGPAILINGLGQALAMERAASGKNTGSDDKLAHDALFKNLCSLLSSSGQTYAGKPDVLAAILSGSQDQYVAAQAEALAWLAWHKKFCQAYLPRGGDLP